jgi:uncharacterized protein
MRSYRKFIVDKVVQESESARSFYLRPADNGPLEPYLPGQHLPVKLVVGDAPIYRCYTLSDCFKPTHYRLTIKRAPPMSAGHSGGQMANHFHDELYAESVVEAQAPAGNFFLDVNGKAPLALIAGGIGITPMISMVNACLEQSSQREIYIVYAVRNSASHAFRQFLHQIARKHANVHLTVLYSQPGSRDVEGDDFDYVGRLDIDKLRHILPHFDMQFYICGPDAMMASLSGSLITAGVPADHINVEHFHVSKPPLSAARAAGENAQSISSEIHVEFRRSMKTANWRADAKSLLVFALENDVCISSGCEYGDCGTCLTPLLSGTVAYNHQTGIEPDPGSCLPCSCKPVTSIVLDA